MYNAEMSQIMLLDVDFSPSFFTSAYPVAAVPSILQAEEVELDFSSYVLDDANQIAVM